MNKKVALITGGARGIGKAVGLALARQGWSVAICYRTSREAAEETAAEFGALGVRTMAEECDVSDPEAAAALVAKVEKAWGRIDLLVNGAGPYHRVPFFEETLEGWHEMFDNNLHPVFYMSRAVAPGMKERKWGRIISFSMANADKIEAQTHITAHYISKCGILVLTRTLAKLLAPSGITVNAISPGFIDSGSSPAEELAGMRKFIPAGYIGSTDDIVSAVLYLVSDEARYVNGANIQISGAWGI